MSEGSRDLVLGQPLTCRAPQLGDIRQVAALERACFTEPWSEALLESALPEGSLPESGAKGSESAEDSCGRPGLHRSAYAFFTEDGTAVAYALTQQIFEIAELLRVAVAPDWRRLGLAAALLHEICGDLRRQAVTVLQLEVAANNAEALALYAQLGFYQSGMRKDYYGSERHALLLDLDLTQKAK